MNREGPSDRQHPQQPWPEPAHEGYAGSARGLDGSRAKHPPRTWVRVWAWALGTLAFLSPWALLGLSPKPAAQAIDPAPPQPPQQPAPVVHRVVKRVVIHQAPPRHLAPKVTYVSGGSGSTGTSGGGSTGGGGGSTGGSG